MGCFIACFGSSKDVKCRKHKPRVQPRDQVNSISKAVEASSSAVDGVSSGPISPILRSREKPEEQKLSSNTRKRVTFNSNVKTYELDHEVADNFLEKYGKEDEKDLSKLPQCKSYSRDDSSTCSSAVSYPPNHRYQNCRDSDDEDELLDYADSVDDDDDDDNVDAEDEEYDDFSEDEDGITTAQAFPEELDSCLSASGLPQKTETPNGVKRNARCRNPHAHSVLKPVENISQWKAVKVKGTLPSNPRKENLGVNGGPKPSFRELSFGHEPKICLPKKNSDQNIAVDASLSNWLSSSEATPTSKTIRSISCALTPESQGSNSLRSQEDRPLLGALTVEELKQIPTSPSPRRSPNRSPYDMPIIGTVGSYWSHSRAAEDSESAFSSKRVANSSRIY